MLEVNPFFGKGSCVNEDGFPFIVFAPQCYADSWFDIFEQLQRFVKMVAEHPLADTNQVSLIGTSMGGYAVWQLAMTMPEFFSAIVPICGGGMKWNAKRLRNLPIWAFHGVEDRIVPPEESIQMVDAVNKAMGNARLALLDHVGHNSWDYVYKQKELFEWLLEQKKSDKAPEYEAENFDGGRFG